MSAQVAAALIMLAVAAVASDGYSARVASTLWTSFVLNIMVEVADVNLLVNHPARVVMPCGLGLLAYSRMYQEKHGGGRVSRGYVMALLAFALAGVDVAALFFVALGGAWIVPAFSILVCALITALALIPKGRVPWLLS